MAANRVAQVNAALKAKGIAERLRRGRGYYYFTEGDAMSWYSSSVPVCHADSLTVARWLEELEALRNDYRNN
jgi:hypothetical protein